MAIADSKRTVKPKRQSARSSAPPQNLDPALQRRVIVENVLPQIDGGLFPIKRTVGEPVTVTADIYADGHDHLGAALLYRKIGADTWTEVPMSFVENDEWAGTFIVESLGQYEYTVEGWVDGFASWRHELSKKVGAGQDVSSELLEGAELVSPVSAAYGKLLADVDTSADVRVADALREELTALMASHPDRTRATRFDRSLTVTVERERARVGAWYEMFPRSAGPEDSRSATFDEAQSMLEYVASMGFEVLYLPPIHPIGRAFRKGANNSLTPRPGEPGSPWAIGSEEGGHTAIEPGLGTIDDFDRFVEAAARHGLEVALDIAFQASPDHPYVREHPEWFRHRPDGSIKYAENPPKKYQDIYPLNFESGEWTALWRELKQIFEFWIAHGVKIFRVDNPHTKPFRFWQWMLGELKRQHPDTIFLSEAFTRPKVMRYLAKCGFSQSYSYFTWRNTKAELAEYFTELTQTDVREYMRPNLFANTPDILHAYLQRGGRPAFQVRFVLAATLGASYGIYSGFELAENVPVREGSEEYLDSEKYQIRRRDYQQTSSLAELISQVNAIRRDHPALQYDWGLTFQQTDNPELLAYTKRSPDGRDIVMVILNLDPFNMQHGFVQLPLAAWGATPHQTVEMHDLLSGERYFWRGEWNYVRLDPQSRVAHILNVELP